MHLEGSNSNCNHDCQDVSAEGLLLLLLPAQTTYGDTKLESVIERNHTGNRREFRHTGSGSLLYLLARMAVAEMLDLGLGRCKGLETQGKASTASWLEPGNAGEVVSHVVWVISWIILGISHVS